MPKEHYNVQKQRQINQQQNNVGPKTSCRNKTHKYSGMPTGMPLAHHGAVHWGARGRRPKKQHFDMSKFFSD